MAFNLTLLSYLGNLDMGLNFDAAAVTEPALMKRCLDRAITDFLAIAELTGGDRQRGRAAVSEIVQADSEATGSGTSMRRHRLGREERADVEEQIRHLAG